MRWQQLGELVNKHIRNVVDGDRAEQRRVGLRVSGAIGMLAHYDSVT